MAVNTNTVLQLKAGGMDLQATLFCGQSFSWQPTGKEGVFRGVAGAHAAEVWIEQDTLHIARLDGAPPQPGDEAFWKHYFALDTDYTALLCRFCDDPVLGECVACSPGLRVLRQPFFDTLLTFIISQNNHIARIAGIVQRLRQEFGPMLQGSERGFPLPETLARLTPEDLAPLRAGFRAKYLIDAAQKVAGGQVREAELRTLDDAAARAVLMRIVGVGVKVADCVLLFALERHNIVPMDVWMKRAMHTTFPDGMPPQAQGSEGIAQQYIFWWARLNLPKEAPKKTAKAPAKPAKGKKNTR